MNDQEVTKAIVEALAAHLASNMASITDADAQIKREWPESEEDLVDYPVISIVSVGDQEFENYGDPHVFESQVNALDPNKFDYKYDVGQYDFIFQIDLWTDYKAKRHALYQEFWAAFNQKFLTQGRMGLTLTLGDYHDAPVHFVMTGYNYGDGEEASQRKEWRVKISVLANCEAVFEATQPAMVDNQAVTAIDDNTKIE